MIEIEYWECPQRKLKDQLVAYLWHDELAEGLTEKQRNMTYDLFEELEWSLGISTYFGCAAHSNCPLTTCRDYEM